jgi:hypothetical protein
VRKEGKERERGERGRETVESQRAARAASRSLTSILPLISVTISGAAFDDELLPASTSLPFSFTPSLYLLSQLFF